MANVTLEAESRELVTEGQLNQMRKQAWIPGVLYGSEKKSSSKSKSLLLKVPEKSFVKSISTEKGKRAIIELKLGSETHHVIIKEIQKDFITQSFLHIDFQRVNMAQKLEMMIPIHISGEAPGVKLSGGILEHVTREIKISCLPKDIPSQITVDVSKLETGQGLSVKDIKEIPGVQVLSDPNLLIVNIVAPTILEETPAAGAAAPGSTEPELIAAKGKKLEEGEAAAAAPAAGGAKQEKAAPAAKEKAAPAK